MCTHVHTIHNTYIRRHITRHMLRLTEKNKPPPIIKITISTFRGRFWLISLLEIDPESCSDHLGGVESDFWWVCIGFVMIFAISLFFGKDGFCRDKPRGLQAAGRSPRRPWAPQVWLNLFRQKYVICHMSYVIYCMTYYTILLYFISKMLSKFPDKLG